MKGKSLMARLLSAVLALMMVIGASPMTYAAESDSATEKLSFEKVEGIEADLRLDIDEEELEAKIGSEHADTDVVRVSIFLDDKATLDKYSTKNVGENNSAMAYREELQRKQMSVTKNIERYVLGGRKLDVVWNLTLAANAISANVQYGYIDEIKAVKGVKSVVLEEQYDTMLASTGAADPLMATSSSMIGSSAAWASGYTGAGTRIAVIDTGLDTDHQSFNSKAFLYSLEKQAEAKGVDYETYLASLDLLGKEEVTSKFETLNIYPYIKNSYGTSTNAWYVNEKVPFALNYVDKDYQYTHDNDTQGGHGSHVAGIAAANSYIADGKGGYTNALETAKVQGVAPDAQLIIMKVFGKIGGAYDSDYMVAIEDAIVLGCDVINLSLGSDKGFTRNADYQHILDKLAQSDTIVTIAAGNSGNFAEKSANGVPYIYADDVDMSVVAQPSTATNSLSVASVENAGGTSYYIKSGDDMIFYDMGSQSDVPMKKLHEIAGDYKYIVIDGLGTEEDLAAVVANEGGKIAENTIFVCARGTINFAVKATNAINSGFAATLIYNNADGAFLMNMQGYTYSNPAASITLLAGEKLKANGEAVKDSEGNVLYYKGELTVSDSLETFMNEGEYVMSDFSSWGVPSSLILKPEITAPGGNIYSVDGTDPSGKGYWNNSGTSMASPQVAGMSALVMQYIRENGLDTKTGLTARQLGTALLMGTAVPVMNNGRYAPVLQQGSGLANVGDAISASAYIKMAEGATSGASDGKVKVELGDDPERTGSYSFSFSVNSISDETVLYSLRSDFFTQAVFSQYGYLWTDTETTGLTTNVSYNVEGGYVDASKDFDCDLNGDGLTNEKDAQVILDYASGKLAEISEKADVSGDGEITTYDAHLLLASVGSGYFVVAPGESIDVTVNVSLTEESKAYMNAAFENGGYVEGYVFVEPLVTEDGAQEASYSIPVLGFYGNWSDASMYDRANYEDYLYYQNGKSDVVLPYSGGLNYLSFYDENDVEELYIGNPYVIEDSVPHDKAAIAPETEFGDMVVTLIRNAGSCMVYFADGEGNIVEAEAQEQLQSAFYHEGTGAWVNVQNVGVMIWATPEQVGGFKEGDKVTLGFMAVPEYYEKDGALTTEDMIELKESGKIGEGAFYEYTFTVDGTAPELLSVEKREDGNLVVKAKDNNYVAAVAALSASGSTVFDITDVEQDTANTEVEAVLNMEGAIVNRSCLIAVCDYAGNETYYKFVYNEGLSDFGGKMYAFSNTKTRGEINSWMEIDPDYLYYQTSDIDDGGNMAITMGGTVDLTSLDCEVTAAEYVNGKVFMITDQNELVVADQGEWDFYVLGAKDKNYAKIRDLAYNTADGKLYALGRDSVIYSVDLYSGELTKEYGVNVEFPKNVPVECYELVALAIDDEGNFYAVNNGHSGYREVYLFKWSAENVSNGKVSGLTPVNNTEDGYLGEYVYNNIIGTNGVETTQTMAWDHDSDILYYAAAVVNASPFNMLYTLDTETGKATATGGSVTDPLIYDYSKGLLNGNIAGLYIVPSQDGTLEEVEAANAIYISKDAVTLLVGSEYNLDCDVTPWNLKDKSLTWSSSDESIATVDEDGVVTAVGEGIVYINATTVAEPHLNAVCKVTVKEINDIKLSGMLYNEESVLEWVEFNLLDAENYTTIHEDNMKGFIAGGFLEDTIYVHDGSHMYGVNADTFEITDYGEVHETWQWSDAAEGPLNDEGLFGRIVGVIDGGRSLGVMNVKTGMGYDMPHFGLTANDKFAVIAYAGETRHTDSYGTYDARVYYVMTESGKLYRDVAWGFLDGDLEATQYTDEITYIGDTGIRLKGAADPSGARASSMYYDAENDYLVVSVYSGSNEAKLYVLQPDACAPVLVGTFGEDVWPVTSLYSYERISELTVKLNLSEASIYADESIELTAAVYPQGNSNKVTWSSSDESIATVDANGVVTAVAEGTVTITATSVATNDEGNHATADAVITVKPLVGVDEMLHAYIETEEGGKWVAIDGNNLELTVTGESDASYTGAGVSGGKIYATDNKYYYEIDPKNEYAATKGDNFTDGEGGKFMYMLDATGAPAVTRDFVDLTTGETVTDVELGGYPVYLSGYDGNGYHYLALLQNFETGDFLAAPIDYTYNPAAVVYDYSEEIEGYWFDFYYVLGYDGLLEHYSIYTGVSNGRTMASGGWERDTMNTGLVFENGDNVSMALISNEEFRGLVISNATENGVEVYLYDLENRKLEKMGTIAEATDLVGLSLLSDTGVELPEEPEAVTSTKLYGYVETEDGNLWAEIDPETFDWTAVSEAGSASYIGGGKHNGKYYVSDRNSYYEIDPENGYAATKGANVRDFYAMCDATSTPEVKVTLGGKEFTIGGYVPYIVGDDIDEINYIMKLRDYTNASTVRANYMGTYDGLAKAIVYVGSELDEAGTTYSEKFLVLDSYGTLYDHSTNWTNNGGTLENKEKAVYRTDLGFSTRKGASMTALSEDEVLISVNTDDGVNFYSFVLSTNTLTKLGSQPEFGKLVALTAEVVTVEPEEPVEPEETAKLHGYINTAEGYLWAEIDTETFEYTAVSEASSTSYIGGGKHNGKYYVSDRNSYYEIDPENGYAATKGANVRDFYAMCDATSTPEVKVTLGGEEFTIGGYVPYIVGDDIDEINYIMKLRDYTNASTVRANYMGTYDGLAKAIVYVGSELDEAGTTYSEKFLVLDSYGTLYDHSTNWTNNGGTLENKEKAVYRADLGFSTRKGASMTALSEDEVLISVNTANGVDFYSFVLSTNTLTKLGTAADYTSLVALTFEGAYVAPDQPGQPDPDEPNPDEPDPDEPKPEDPVEPSENTGLFGYVNNGDGYLWARIDADTLDYEEITMESTDMIQAAVEHNGKIYAAKGVSKYGNISYTYYEIDPANGYTETVGAAAASNGMSNLYDIAMPSDGAYLLEAADGKYSSLSPKLYLVNSWKNTTSRVDAYVSSSTFKAKIANVTFLETDTTSGSRVDSYLLMTQDGKIYDLKLTEVSTTNFSARITEIGDLGIRVTGGSSMVAVSEDVVYITANTSDGVTVFKYTISTNTVEEIGAIEDFISLAGLYYVPAEAAATADLQLAESIHEETEEAEAVEAVEVNGSTMSVVISGEGNGTDGFEPGQVAYKDGKVLMNLSDTESSTNGKIVITFDPSVLKFESIVSGAAYYSANTSDAENGKIVFAYASAAEIPAGNILASVTFSSTEETLDSDVTIETVERGNEVLTSEKTVINVNNKSDDNRLKSITVENAVLTPEFNPNTTDYEAMVGTDVEKLVVEAEANDSKATVEIDNPELVPGETTVITIKVTAENGDVREYRIKAYRAKAPVIEDDDDDVIDREPTVIIDMNKGKGEKNPETGAAAPVFGAIAVLAAAVVLSGKRR